MMQYGAVSFFIHVGVIAVFGMKDYLKNMFKR
jgi:hypothetical protein